MQYITKQGSFLVGVKKREKETWYRHKNSLEGRGNGVIPCSELGFLWHAVALLLSFGYFMSIGDSSFLNPCFSLLQELHLIAYQCTDLLCLFLS